MWHIHVTWMLCVVSICLVSLVCLFRHQIYIRLFGKTSSMQSMNLLWIENGANTSKLKQTLTNIHSLEGTLSHSWVFEFSNIAKAFYKKQLLVQVDKNKHTNHNQNLLKQAYHQASLWFGIAKYPHLFDNKSREEAYKLHQLCYLKSMKMNSDLLQFTAVKIPTQRPNKMFIPGYLHKSIVSKKKDKAFVILIGSIDIWKTDLWFITQSLLKNNISVFIMDLAGTGDNTYKLDKNSMHVYYDTIKWLKQANKKDNLRLNVNNLGVFGVGFGGYFAVKLAQYDAQRRHNNIKFIINLSGPLIYTFNQAWISRMDRHMIKACCFALDIKRGNKYNLYTALKTWKLDNYNDESLGACKILSIFGGNDRFINPLDANVFSGENNSIYFENDGYLCTENINKWLPQTVDWIKNF